MKRRECFPRAANDVGVSRGTRPLESLTCPPGIAALVQEDAKIECCPRETTIRCITVGHFGVRDLAELIKNNAQVELAFQAPSRSRAPVRRFGLGGSPFCLEKASEVDGSFRTSPFVGAAPCGCRARDTNPACK